NPDSVLTFRIGLPDRAYPTRAAAVAAHLAILDRLAAIPGVVAVSASSGLPLGSGCMGNTLLVQNRPIPPGTTPPIARFCAVAGGYFEAMGMRLLGGRRITRDDVERSLPVVVVNEALAKRVFPNQNPLGQYVSSNAPPARAEGAPGPTPLEIVGVVSNTPSRSLAEPDAASQLYMPMSIAGGPGIPPTALLGPDVALMAFVVRSTTPPSALLPSVRGAVSLVDPKLALALVTTLQAMVDSASAQMAFTMVLLAVAAGVALMLGVIGIYGVMSYIVSQRTAEIGVRLALGAEPRSVAAMILRQGGAVAVAGAVVGLVAAFAGSRLIASLLFGISPHDPAVFAATTVLLLIVVALACWLPARSAARLSPVEALRAD